MLRQWLLSCTGSLRIRVSGSPIERFLNLCLREKIRLRQIVHLDWNLMECSIPVSDFRRLQSKMGRTGCRVHILRREGMPFLLRLLRKRVVFCLGFFALGAVLWALHTHLWILEIKTPPGVSSAELSRALAEEGVCIGMRLDSFDDRAVQRRLMLKMDSISYITFNRTGTRMVVEAHAKQDKAPVRDESAITSVVARRAGQIVRVTPTGGWPVVQPGDIVAAGEKLIDALVPPSRDIEGLTPRLTWSDGEVIARTWYQTTFRRPLTALHKQYTGKTTTQYALIWGKHRINLYLGSGICGSGCDKIIEVSYLTVTEGLTLPLALVRQTYRYYEPVAVTLEEETLRQEIEARAVDALTKELHGELTSYSSTARATEAGAVEVQFSAEALEDIGEAVEDGQTLPPPAEPENEQE